jgi:hypothetical protein
MPLDDEVQRRSDELKRLREETDRVKKNSPAEVGGHLARFEKRLEKLAGEVRDTARKLESGVRGELEEMLRAWDEAKTRMGGHLRLIEAKAFLVSAKRMAAEGDVIGAENELASAIADAKEASQLLVGDDTLEKLTREIMQAAASLRAKAASLTADIESAVRRTEDLLEGLESTR